VTDFRAKLVSVAGGTGYRDTWLWNLGFSAYWFATSYKWFVLLLIVLPLQVIGVLTSEGIARGLTPEAAAEWAESVKDGRWGIVIGAGALWATIGPAIFGGLSDRVRTRWGHRQPFIAVGAAMTAMAVAFLADASAYWMLIVGYFLLQFSDDVGTGPYSAMVPELVPEERRGRASSIMSMLQLLGQLASGGVAIGIAIAGGDSIDVIKTLYLGIGSVNILCAVWTLYTVRNVRAGAVLEESKEPFLKRWARPFKNRDFRWVWYTRFINALGFYLIVEFLLYFLRSAYTEFSLFGTPLPGADSDDPATTATLFLALTMALTGAIGAGVASRYADKIGRKPLIYASGVIVFCTMVPFAFVRDFTLAWLIAGLFGVGYGLFLAADWALVSDIIPNKDAAGTEMGVWQMSISSVQTLAIPFGFAISYFNRLSKDAGYMGAIVLAGCLFLTSTILVRQVKGSR